MITDSHPAPPIFLLTDDKLFFNFNLVAAGEPIT